MAAVKTTGASKDASSTFDKTLRIAARPERGFWRCGVHHPAQAVDHPPGTFTAEEAERLKKEPNLVVVELDAPAEKPASK